MTDADRELLELAAKSAGMKMNIVGNGVPGGQVTFYAEPGQLYWNPLTDDGDALRLLVSLREKLALDAGSMFGLGQFKKWDEDPMGWTRRAIVFEAAEIGRTQ